jgi:fermentation-respiration switch protein FrsA (DUF1100 family)
MESTERTFSFEAQGVALRGRLHLPNREPKAAVVLTGPMTSVKEQAAGAYARALADRGYAALAFDHRYYGESGGEPRQFENPGAKVEDIGAAAEALRRDAQTRSLPLCAVGVCAGGGYMAAAVAKGNGFKAFAGVAGYYSEATPESIAASRPAIERARAAERRWREAGVAETVPAVAPDGGDVGMPLREAYEYYGTPRGAVPNYVNGYAIQSRAYTIPFNAIAAAPAIAVPTLMVHSEAALAPPLARRFFDALHVPREQLWLKSQGQIDFYDDPALIAASADAIVKWFDAALAKAS